MARSAAQPSASTLAREAPNCRAATQTWNGAALTPGGGKGAPNITPTWGLCRMAKLMTGSSWDSSQSDSAASRVMASGATAEAAGVMAAAGTADSSPPSSSSCCCCPCPCSSSDCSLPSREGGVVPWGEVPPRAGAGAIDVREVVRGRVSCVCLRCLLRVLCTGPVSGEGTC